MADSTRWKKFGAWAAACGSSLLVGVLAGLIVKITPTPKVEDTEGVGAMGWVDDPEAVEKIVSSRAIKSFRDTPAFANAGDTPDHIYLWDYARQVLGHNLPANNQGRVGCCVAFGAKGAIDHLQLIQIAKAQQAGKPPPEFKPVAPEVIYGGSRIQIGQGRIRGEGSVGAWAIQFCEQYGVEPQTKVGPNGKYDLSTYSESLCRRWGSQGVPSDLLPDTKNAPVQDGAPVRTADEAEKALANLYPITVASNQGFSQIRDNDGFLRPAGSWGHQMCILGYQKGSRPGFLIWNSWGPTWASGPKGAGDPPDGAFWADRNVVERMLAQNDSWAYASMKGFPSTKPDVFLKAKPPGRRDLETIYALAP